MPLPAFLGVCFPSGLKERMTLHSLPGEGTPGEAHERVRPPVSQEAGQVAMTIVHGTVATA